MSAASSASLAPYALAALAVIYAVLLWPVCRAFTEYRARRSAEERAGKWARKESL